MHQKRLRVKILQVQCILLVIFFSTKHEIPTYEAVKIVLCLPMRHSSIDVFYVPIGLRKSITRMFKWLSILEKVKPNYTNVFEANIIAKYENRPYNLHATCPADYPSSYVSKRQVICT